MDIKSIKDPKIIFVLAGLLVFGGSIFGYTVEPEDTTNLRVENAILTERTSHLESTVSELAVRVEELETIVDACRRIVSDEE